MEQVGNLLKGRFQQPFLVGLAPVYSQTVVVQPFIGAPTQDPVIELYDWQLY